MIIYKTINLLNRKVYVGKDTYNNQNYLGSGILIVRAIKKYGKLNFKKEIIDIVESQQELNEKEMYWIKLLNCRAPNGYNLTDGGEGISGYIFDAVAKKKISEAMKGKPSWNSGKKGIYSERHKKNIAKAIKGKKRPDLCGENSPTKRPEVRKKMSEARKGKTFWSKGKESKKCQ
jgi:group I intron endonuclease